MFALFQRGNMIFSAEKGPKITVYFHYVRLIRSEYQMEKIKMAGAISTALNTDN